MRAVRSLWWREIVRFLRQPSRVVGALGQPIVFWLLLGGGLACVRQRPRARAPRPSAGSGCRVRCDQLVEGRDRLAHLSRQEEARLEGRGAGIELVLAGKVADFLPRPVVLVALCVGENGDAAGLAAIGPTDVDLALECRAGDGLWQPLIPGERHAAHDGNIGICHRHRS